MVKSMATWSLGSEGAGHPTPTTDPLVCAVHAGICRSKGTAPTVKAPAVTSELWAMVENLPDDLRGTRDRAMLLVGFAAALRRSELVALDVADVAETVEGLVVTLRRSKTDPEGGGRQDRRPLLGSRPLPAPCALCAWTAAAGDGS